MRRGFWNVLLLRDDKPRVFGKVLASQTLGLVLANFLGGSDQLENLKTVPVKLVNSIEEIAFVGP